MIYTASRRYLRRRFRSLTRHPKRVGQPHLDAGPAIDLNDSCHCVRHTVLRQQRDRLAIVTGHSV